MDTLLWFPITRSHATLKLPIEVCESCSVKQPCLDYSLHNKIEFGIWGGLREHERIRLLRDY